MEARNKKKDVVSEYLREYGDKSFKCRLGNTCYKPCAHIQSMKKNFNINSEKKNENQVNIFC